MSVLIEAVCLVVPRRVLDVSYPGATDAFLAAVAAREGVRFAIADDHLTSVSAFDGNVLVAIVDELMELGLVWSDRGRVYEAVIVDQETGPAIPCDWLEVQRHPHGFTQAWHAIGAFAPGTAGDLLTPDGWRLEVSWRLTRSDVRDGNDDWLHLSTDDDGLETWLDFTTGRMRRALPDEPTVFAMDPAAAPGGTSAEARARLSGRAIRAVQSVLEVKEIPYRVDVEHGYVVIPFATQDVDRVQLMVSPVRGGETLRCDAVLPDRVAAAALLLVHGITAALSSACPGCTLAVDEQTRSLHVTTWVPPHPAQGRLTAIERALCHAADQAGRVHAALVRAASEGAPPAECIEAVVSAQGQLQAR